MKDFVALCNLNMNIEDEIHFLFHCPNYSSIIQHDSLKIYWIIETRILNSYR